MKYVPAFVPSNIEDLPRHVDQELARISESIDTNRWEHTHVHITADHDAGEYPYIFADATAGNIVVYLPAPFDEMILCVKKVDSSANTVTLNPRESGTVSIDGAASKVLSSQYEVATVYWDKEDPQWWVV